MSTGSVVFKVMTIVGTRPEIIRLSRIIDKLDRYCDHTLVHTGQNFDFELNQIFFEELGIRRPDHFLEAAGRTPAETIGRVIIAIDKLFELQSPDAVLILGDTNSALSAVVAKRRHIPIFHMEAGNRSFDSRVPEEINRRIVDHTADIHLTYSQIARDYLVREGIAPDQVICTGSPMREVLEYYREGIRNSDVLKRLGLTEGGYYLVSAHREENVDSPSRLRALFDVLTAIAERDDMPVIVSTHPRTRQRIDAAGWKAPAQVLFCKPFGFLDYVRLQESARAVLSDSGTITEESSILNFPAINLRDAHERPEGMEEAAVMFVGLDTARVLSALQVLEHQGRGAERTLQMVRDYEATNVSDKIVRIIQSYTSYVNQRVWMRQ